MPQVATMSVKFAADIADFEKNVTKAEKTFLASAKSMTQMGEELSLKLTAPFLLITGVMAKSAADAEASMARFTRIFGPATDQVDAFAKQMMKVLPETRSEIEQLLGTTQAFVSQLGLTPRATLAMTESLTKLASDIAAFRHLDVSEVMQSLERGMAGRTQGLVGLGIAINKAAVAERAYSMGLAQRGEKLTVAAQSQATLSLVMEKTANIQGEAAKTAGDSANALKFLHQATTELAEEWGKSLLPMATSLVHSLTDITHQMTGAADSTKLLVFGIGAAAAAGGPLLIVAGSLIRNFTEVAKVMRMVAGAEGLMGLAAGGAVVVAVVAGLAAIGYWFYKSGEDARNAKAAVDQYKASLMGLSTTQLTAKVSSAYSNLEFASGNLAAAKSAPFGMKAIGPAGPGGAPTYVKDTDGHASAVAAAQLAYDQALSVAQAATKAYNDAAQMTYVKAGTSVLGGDDGKAAKKAFDAFTANADRLLKLQPQLEQGWTGITALGNKQLDMYNRLTAALAAQTDQYGEQAVKLRDLISQYQALHAVQLVTGTTMMTPQSLMSVTPLWNPNDISEANPLNVNGAGFSTFSGIGGIPDQNKNIDLQNLPSIPSKLDMLGGIFKDSIASQAQFIAQSLSTVLGIKQANAGGAIGSVLGGAVGKGVAAAALGSTAGAFAGSVIPVVGTIVGSLAGGLIGNAIGNLFGGGGSANTATTALSSLATAAQSVTAALSNVPTGFKIALDRFRVSDPSAVPFGASLPPGYSAGGSGVTFNGPVTVVTQAQTADQLYKDMTTRARRDSLRGGTTQWQLAGAGA